VLTQHQLLKLKINFHQTFFILNNLCTAHRKHTIVYHNTSEAKNFYVQHKPNVCMHHGYKWYNEYQTPTYWTTKELAVKSNVVSSFADTAWCLAFDWNTPAHHSKWNTYLPTPV